MDWKWLGHELVHGVFHVDHGIFFTIKELFTRPRLAIRDYLEGKRKRYFPPVTLLVVASAAMITMESWTSNVAHRLSGPIPEHSDPKQHDNAIEQVLEGHMNWVLLSMIPIHGLGSWLFLRGYGHNFVEHAIINTFLGAQAVLILLPAIMVSQAGRTTGVVSIVIVSFLMQGYRLWAFVQIYRERPKWKVVIRTLAGMITSAALAGLLGQLFLSIATEMDVRS